jgi:hypothetical protein
MTTKTESLVRQLSQLDPARPFSYPGNEADIDLRIQRILETPTTDVAIAEPAHKTWRRPVVCGLAASVAMALVAILMWASPAEGSFSPGKVAAPENVRPYAPLNVSGEGYPFGVGSAFVSNS